MRRRTSGIKVIFRADSLTGQAQWHRVKLLQQCPYGQVVGFIALYLATVQISRLNRILVSISDRFGPKTLVTALPPLLLYIICDASWQNQRCGCASSEDSDQPGHPPSLIRVFPVRMKKAWVLSYPVSAHSEDSDQTGQMPRLIWVFAGRTLTLLVLSWGGSY